MTMGLFEFFFCSFGNRNIVTWIRDEHFGVTFMT